MKGLKVLTTLSNVAGYNIHTQKSRTFMYRDNELNGKEIIETVVYIVPSRNIKYLGTDQASEVKDLYKENYQTPRQT